MRRAIEASLVVRTESPDKLTLTYQKQLPPADRDRVRQLLDALGRARLGYQLTLDALDERDEASLEIIQSATLEREPIEDRSLVASAGIFGGSVAATLILILLVRWRLSAAQRVFDFEKTGSMLRGIKDEDAWPRDSLMAAPAESLGLADAT